MHTLKTLWLFAVASLIMISCSPISPQLQKEALKVPFKQIMENPSRYQGELVLLGGYVIKTQVQANETRLVVLQAPLGFKDRPQSSDKSQGRFLVIYDGFLDPQVYQKNRAVTVAGTVLGKTTEKVDACPYSCLTIKSREIYLWPIELYYYYPYYGPYYYFGPYYGPFYEPFWGYPFYRRPFGYPYYYPYWYYPYW
jgi:outer membrane lipoprotein